MKSLIMLSILSATQATGAADGVDWTAIFEALKEVGLFGYLIGLLAIPVVTAAWQVIKEGYEAHKAEARYVEEYGPDVSQWPDEALRKYAQENYEFWEALGGFWNTVWRGIRKLFTKKKSK